MCFIGGSRFDETVFGPTVSGSYAQTCFYVFFYPQTSRLKLLVKPCPGLGFRCRCFARATPLPRRRPPTDKPPLCSLAGIHLASLQLAALQTVAASGAGGFCFREAYYHMYPISTDDLIYARGHYPWTVDGGGRLELRSNRSCGHPPSPPPLPPTGRGVGMGGWGSGPQLRFDRSAYKVFAEHMNGPQIVGHGFPVFRSVSRIPSGGLPGGSLTVKDRGASRGLPGVTGQSRWA